MKRPPDTSGLAFPKPTKRARLDAKALARSDHLLAVAQIRAACELRARARPHPHARARARYPACEWCGVGRGEELHHLEGGRGRRREEQRVENCVLICSGCHLTWGLDPAKVAERARECCVRLGLPIPSWFTKPSRAFLRPVHGEEDGA